MKLKEFTISANTGLDAIKRAPIVEEDTGLKCIRIQDISQGKDFDDWGNTLTTDRDFHKFRLKIGDLLVARTGATVGVSFLVKENYNAVFNNGSIRLRFNNKIDTAFVYYIFKSKEFLQYIENVSCVATQPNLRVENLLRFNIPDFSISIQQKIASALSAYDNLIENNNKRIRLLEQMAENLYKEWFVRFRFPGHEKAEFENGLPKGWDKSPLSEICEFKRGKNITSDEMCEGNIPVISAGIGVSGYHSKANVKGVSITMSSSGANAGYISLHYTDIWAADCSFIDESTTPNIFYVYELLNNLRAVITNFQRGAAQPHVYPKDINRIKLVVPNNDLMVEANKKLAVIHKEIHHLQQQSNLLSRQRDLLLPRLMSGKLEVKI